MDPHINIFFTMLAQITGAGDGVDYGLAPCGFAAIFWALLLAFAIARQRQGNFSDEKLLLWGFGCGLGRELFMFLIAVISAFGLVPLDTARRIFPPLEQLSRNLAEVVVAAAFLNCFNRTKGWQRKTVCAALGLFLMDVLFKLADMALGEAYAVYFAPLRHGCYLFAIPLLGLVYLKGLFSEFFQYQASLEQMVAAQTANLLEGKIRAEQENQAKSEFLANVSHEFRTPLHAILSFSSFGISRIDTAGREKLLDYFAKIHSAGEKLLPRLNDILDLTKLEAGKMQYTMKEQDLTALAWEAAAIFETLALEKNLILELPPATCLHLAVFDRDKIGQVLQNFLANAIKFTPAGKKISIEITKAILPQANMDSNSEIAALTLCVVDEGIGISETELESIFEQFVQGSKTLSRAGGTGLGLSISRKIINDHCGRAWAENNPAGGASFCFSIPKNDLKDNPHEK